MTQVTQKPFESGLGTLSASTYGFTVTATSAHLAFTPTGVYRTMRVVNVGTQTVFIRIGAGTQTAIAPTLGGAAGDFPLLPNTVAYVQVHPEWNDLAAIAASTGSVVYFSCGEGGIV